MSHLKRLNLALRKFECPDPTSTWRRILVLAVKGNSYDQDTEIRVLMYLHLDMYPELLAWADAISQHVYEEPMLHYRMHQLAALIRKYPLPEAISGHKPKEAAMATFLAMEHRCKRINQRFRAIRRTSRDPLGAVTWHARNWIRYVIGTDVPYSEIYKSCDITPGACVGVHGNATNLARKLSSERWSVTPGAYPFALEAIWENAHMVEWILRKEDEPFYSADPKLLNQRLRERVDLVRYNKVAFVPKTAKTHRSIAVEPFLNTFLQSGVDAVLKRRLTRVGIDLTNQADNSRMAYLGSIQDTDPYCTIDLSAASDTLAKEVVRELLPEDWFLFLSRLRSPSFRLAKSSAETRYEKFTSMGNGFCFPLESLIFAAICHGVSAVHNRQPDLRVYGDDIVVRQSIASDVLVALRHFGFIPNPRKTFLQGKFRESCGMDYHSGVNVRPIFLDHPLKKLTDVFGFHNQSRRRESYVEAYFEEVRAYLYEIVPKHLRFCSPFDPSPHLIRHEDPESWKSRTIDGTFWVPLDSFMASRHARWNRNTSSWSYFSIQTQACTDSMFRGGKEDNSFLFHIAALRGAASRSTFTLRYQARSKVVAVNSQ